MMINKAFSPLFSFLLLLGGCFFDRRCDIHPNVVSSALVPASKPHLVMSCNMFFI